MLFRYVNYPCLPEILIPEVFKSAEAENTFWNTKDDVSFSEHKASDPLRDWFNNNIRPMLSIPNDRTLMVQCLRKNPPSKIHKDFKRDLALNYLIQPGGNNVITTHYDDELNILTENKIEIYRWHEIATNVFHCPVGIENKRIALSVKLK